MSLECKNGCGKCCEVGGTQMILPVTEVEARAVAKALGREVVTPVKQGGQSHCPAYSNGSCMAYEARPQVCRDFQCNGKEHFTHSKESFAKMVDLSKRIDPVFDLRAFLPETVKSILNRHTRIALNFSGGKDSLACLLLLRPFLEKITVYWLNAGDGFPETLEIIKQAKKFIPHFVEVSSSVFDVVQNYGIPSDLVPYGSTAHAHALNAGVSPLMQDRVACCYRSIMEPMYRRMKQDGITLIIRGQKNSDEHKGAISSGQIIDGIEFLHPVEFWTQFEVIAFIKKHGFAEQDYYTQGMAHAPECMTCSAWWDDGHGKYLETKYPEKHKEYKKRIEMINGAVSAPMQNLKKELYG